MGAVGAVGRRVMTTARVGAPHLARARRAHRRRRFIRRLKVSAIWVGAAVDVHVDPAADISPSVSLEIWPGTRTTVVIGAGATVGDNVRLSLRGGRLEVGERTQIRRLSTFHIGGEIRIGRDTMLGVGSYVHCSEAVEVGDDTLVAEYSTLADSDHLRTAPGVPVMHHVRTAPVRIGDNVWVASHSVITRGTTICDQAVVAAGSVVTTDVPRGWLVAGAPGRLIRELDIDET